MMVIITKITVFRIAIIMIILLSLTFLMLLLLTMTMTKKLTIFEEFSTNYYYHSPSTTTTNFTTTATTITDAICNFDNALCETTISIQRPLATLFPMYN